MIVWFYSDRKLESWKEKHEKFFKVDGNTCLGTCSHESGMVPLPLGKSKGLLLWENLNILYPLKSASVYFDWPEKKLIFSQEDVAVSYRYIIALYMFYRKKEASRGYARALP